MSFSLLTLNLHTWQEPEAQEKLDRVADRIARERVDVVCLQECAQDRGRPFLPSSNRVREDNAAHLIVSRLRTLGLEYAYAWEWVHYGFDRWEEGCAVLSRHPIVSSQFRAISAETDPRKPLETRHACLAAIELAPGVIIDVFSVHTSWQSMGLEPQLDRLVDWAGTRRGLREAAFVAGDFNDPPGGPARRRFLAAGFADHYEICRPGGLHDRTTRDRRIDYIFSDVPATWRPRSAERVFTGEDEPPVSDHMGVLARWAWSPGAYFTK